MDKLEIDFDLIQALDYINKYVEKNNEKNNIADNDICKTIINLLKLSMKK